MLAHEGKGLLMRGEGAKVEAKAVDGVRLHFFPFVGTSLAWGSDSRGLEAPRLSVSVVVHNDGVEHSTTGLHGPTARVTSEGESLLTREPAGDRLALDISIGEAIHFHHAVACIVAHWLPPFDLGLSNHRGLTFTR